MRYAVLVTGPAGAGKSTFSTAFATHLRMARRTAHTVNLDPAATGDAFEYEPAIDIRELVTLEDVMTEMGMGPNGGLVYCFEYLLQNMDWLEDELGGYDEDYLIIDCPGQIELYTHHPFLPILARNLQRMGIRTCAAYLIDSQFMEDRYKFFSGVLSAMSAMVNLEIPWINIMSKMDLVSPAPSSEGASEPRNGRRTRRDISRYLDPDPVTSCYGTRRSRREWSFSRPQPRLGAAEDHPLVSFLPLDLTSTESLEVVVSHIDFTMQYGEDEEPKEPNDLDEGDFPEAE
ncbi:GPN-loop GTPase [Pisolithus microcarpus]|nr:GPN-loop GTPase [Pisolithus microcarpus]